MARQSVFPAPWALLAFVGVLAWARTEAQPVQMDFVTHNEIVIDAPAARIWPHIVRLADWKKGSQQIVINGAEDQIGGRSKAVGGNSQVVEFYTENVEVVPPRLRTIRLTAPDGTLIGYASWRLTPHNKSMLVQYDVYCWVTVPVESAAASPQAIAAAKKSYFDVNYRRFAEELVGLKKLVEKAWHGKSR